MNRHADTAHDQGNAGAYRPLIAIVVVVLLASIALQVDKKPWQLVPWMRDYMGLFMVIFSMVKLFDLSGFADGFSMYDMAARRFRAYGFMYPFLELFLGLAYLSGIALFATYMITIAVMTVSSIGVIRSLMRGLDVHCACMGNILKVPLSTVSIVENVGMGCMALIMLILEMHR